MFEIESSHESLVKGPTPLHRLMNAISGHNTAGVREILAEGAVDVNRRYQNDMSGDVGSPLIFAAERGYGDILQILLHAGARTDVTNIHRTTPLMMAAYGKHAEAVKLLLAAGADIEAAETGGGTALSLAEERGAADVVALLQQATIQRKEKEQERQESHAATGKPKPAELIAAVVDHADIDLVKKLLDRGADVNETDKDGASALIYAAMNGHNDIIEELLKHGADITLKDREDCTALFYAASNGFTSALKLLNDPDIDAPNVYGYTPLMHAAMNGHLAAVQYLLDAGADISIAAKNGATLINMTETGDIKDTAVIAVLEEADTIHQVAKCGKDPNERDENGNTLLIDAVLRDQPRLIACLLDHGADIDATNDEGQTSLIVANMSTQSDGSEERLELSRLLTDKGANVNVQDAHSGTALMYAAHGGAKDTVQLLLSKGAETDTKDNNGDTADQWTKNEEIAAMIRTAREVRQADLLRRKMAMLKSLRPGLKF